MPRGYQFNRQVTQTAYIEAETFEEAEKEIRKQRKWIDTETYQYQLIRVIDPKDDKPLTPTAREYHEMYGHPFKFETCVLPHTERSYIKFRDIYARSKK